MAEIDETLEVSPSPIQPEATTPTVSDINFEDVADMIGSSPGDLAKLQM
jgi:hypothetical protein